MTMLAPPPKRARRAKGVSPPDVVADAQLSQFYELLHAARFVVRCTGNGRRIVRAEATDEDRAVQSAMTGTPPVRRVAITLTPPVLPATQDDTELHLHVGMLDVLLVRPWPEWVAVQLGREAMRYAERGMALFSGSVYDEAAGEERLEATHADLVERIRDGRAEVVQASTPGALTLAACRLCDAVDEALRLPYEASTPGDVPHEIQPFVMP